jgi:single-stranded DNA-binding protein
MAYIKEEVKYANRLALSGNLVDVPQVHTFENGGSLMRFKIAQNQGYKTKEGEWVDTDTLFWKFVVNGPAVEAIEAMNLLKGDTIVIHNSKLEPANWTNKENERRYDFEAKIFKAEDVTIASRLAERQAAKAVAADIEPVDAVDDNPF